jgi:hypothetical protein
MRIHQAVSVVLVAAAVATACTGNTDDCSKNPELACYVEATGSGGATASTTGTGSTTACDYPCVSDRQLDGQSCGSGERCESGFCADGVCCHTACDGLCEACNLPGTEGTCSPLPAGTPDDQVVDGDGKAWCADKGGCGTIPGNCFQCEDGVKNGDEVGVDCGGSSCNAKCGIGSPCAPDGAAPGCVSGYCVDGYCCNTPCDNACEACSVPEHPGLCLPLAPGVPDICPTDTECSTVGTCARGIGQECNGNDKVCSTHMCSPTSTCMECVGAATCNNGQACIQGACFDKAENGALCQADDGCSGGHCVDGVCCESACDGLCMGCHSDYTGKPTGTCAPILLGYDPHDECPDLGAATCSGTLAGNATSSSCGKP